MTIDSQVASLFPWKGRSRRAIAGELHREDRAALADVDHLRMIGESCIDRSAQLKGENPVRTQRIRLSKQLQRGERGRTGERIASVAV